MLFSAAHGKRKPFCILIGRFPHILELLPSWHIEEANLRCLQYMAAQLCRGALHLPEVNESVVRSPISNHFLIVQVLETQILICVCICTPSVRSFSIPQSSFSHSS